MGLLGLIVAAALIVTLAAALAALAADKAVTQSASELLSLAVSAGEMIYNGALVCVDSDGYAVPAADTAGYVFMGVATQQADNSSGADGAVNVTIKRCGRFLLGWNGAGLTQAAVGNLAYAVDDQTVDAPDDTTNDVLIGQITRIVGASQAWVDIGCGARAGGGAWTEPTTTTTAL